MTDRGRVINELRFQLESKEVKEQHYSVQLSVSDAEKILDLLKEQEAKPVIVTTNAYGTRFYHCPRCNRDLYVYPRQLYCSNCGQELKWE